MSTYSSDEENRNSISDDNPTTEIESEEEEFYDVEEEAKSPKSDKPEQNELKSQIDSMVINNSKKPEVLVSSTITTSEESEKIETNQTKKEYLTEEEQLKQCVIRNLETGEVMSLLEFTDKYHDPVHQLITRRKKDYEENKEEEEDKKEEKKQGIFSKIFGKKNGKKEETSKEDKTSKENKKKSSEKKKKNPNSIKTYVNKKTVKQFTDVQCVQKITAHAGAIWVMKFNHNGQYLATGGQDGYVIVWKVNRKKRKRKRSETKDVPWIDPVPFKKFLNGQSGDVLDLAWSKSNFLLTSTMDKKVRAWHVTRKECLGTFVHAEIVTGVQFHPLNETLFITGSFDEKLRLFNLRDREMIHFVDTKYMITAVGFNGDGKIAMAGTYDGKCLFYNVESDGFKKITMLDVRSRRGKNKGRKVTGITLSPDQEQLLITTNDSRIRLYSLHDYSQTCKYSGLQNQSSQIRATFSSDGNYIITGSEDNSVYIWNTANNYFPTKQLFAHYKKDRNVSYESFSAHPSIVTNAVFAPFVYSDPDDDEKKVEEKKEETIESDVNLKDIDTKKYIVITGDFKGEIQVFENFGDAIQTKNK